MIERENSVVTWFDIVSNPFLPESWWETGGLRSNWRHY